MWVIHDQIYSPLLSFLEVRKGSIAAFVSRLPEIVSCSFKAGGTCEWFRRLEDPLGSGFHTSQVLVLSSISKTMKAMLPTWLCTVSLHKIGISDICKTEVFFCMGRQ